VPPCPSTSQGADRDVGTSRRRDGAARIGGTLALGPALLPGLGQRRRPLLPGQFLPPPTPPATACRWCIFPTPAFRDFERNSCATALDCFDYLPLFTGPRSRFRLNSLNTALNSRPSRIHRLHHRHDAHLERRRERRPCLHDCGQVGSEAVNCPRARPSDSPSSPQLSTDTALASFWIPFAKPVYGLNLYHGFGIPFSPFFRGNPRIVGGVRDFCALEFPYRRNRRKPG